MNIRLAKPEDLTAIIEIEAKCFPPAEAASAKDIKKRFSVFMDSFVVAEDQSKVIGFINGCCHDKPQFIDELYHDISLHNKNGAYQMIFGLDVIKEYRKQGVGEMLMNFFVVLARKRNKKAIVLTCKDELIHYYEKFNFKHQGVSSSTHGNTKWNDMILIL